MITVLVDYDSGNLHSAAKAFERMARETDRGDVIISNSPDMVARADRLVLPGDGAFPACRAALLAQEGLFEAITEAVHQRKIPFLGICIGMQMMAGMGHEYELTKGFDWIKGEVVPIKPQNPALKVPHMGWNDLIIDHDHPIFTHIAPDSHAYFVHSYHVRVENPAHRLAHVDYEGDITAVIGHENMLGMQFHPEKSHKTGLQLIRNFMLWKP